MPRIYDNIERYLAGGLDEALTVSSHADFCVGYFNLRGWKPLQPIVEEWAGGPGACVRLLVGMQRTPHAELRESLEPGDGLGIDNATAVRLRRVIAENFREQLTFGTPTNADEESLRLLAVQLRAKKVVVKLHLRHTLHAKVYLCHRESQDSFSPSIGFVGSSNLTFSGLAGQGELNVDVVEGDACAKLAAWFEDRWTDRFSVDISDELADIIDESWAGERLRRPYDIYIKMAYHLCQEARVGLAEFGIPADMSGKLLAYQTAAVKIAAHHLNKRNGVVLGDVVGFGKTLMATALARVFQEDLLTETLVICPKNLVKMWQHYFETYRIIGRVMSLSRVLSDLPTLRRYRVVILDESHNLRNREGKRYKAIRDYIASNDSKCVLISATPYNKSYLDLSAQLRLFVPEDADLGVRPEHILREIGETEFIRRHQAPVRSLAAFEHSPYVDDWRELMRLYLVRRTRTFIKENYAGTDPDNGRAYLTFDDGERFYFPKRVPLTVKVEALGDPDPYQRLQSTDVVSAVDRLSLPRYGLGNYVADKPNPAPSPSEQDVLDGLSRAGQRLMGFSRTNLFKRLESGGPAFLTSLKRHALRNYVFIHAIDNGLDLPLGTQDADLLDAAVGDRDTEEKALLDPLGDEDAEDDTRGQPLSVADLQAQAVQVYGMYAGALHRRFKWVRANLFDPSLRDELAADCGEILDILAACGEWDPHLDGKLQALRTLLIETHPDNKVLVFSQFKDTIDYLQEQLMDVDRVGVVTGEVADPTSMAWRFSPASNNANVDTADELRVLLATDVLSEGQNLQDCSIIVNFDLPWAIIRLIQRAGRVDRLGQLAETIRCYSFLPSEGVEVVIGLRRRVRQRLQENAEVVGTDEAFFEDDLNPDTLVDLYNEKAGVLDGDGETEVDLTSFAYQIWKNAITDEPKLEQTIPAMADMVYAAKLRPDSPGSLMFIRTSHGNDALVWLNNDGETVTESQFAILSAAACEPDTTPMKRAENHHALVRGGVELTSREESSIGGQLGRPSGARFKTYERLKRHLDSVRGTLLETGELIAAVDEVYRYPLRQTAIDTLNRQLRSGISDAALADLVTDLRREDRLSIHQDGGEHQAPQIVCSMSLVTRAGTP